VEDASCHEGKNSSERARACECFGKADKLHILVRLGVGLAGLMPRRPPAALACKPQGVAHAYTRTGTPHPTVKLRS